ncbi:MAG: hypothetical protein ACYSUY_03845 [Planctomycetota bacterium]|jgi:hypothetical protein
MRYPGNIERSIEKSYLENIEVSADAEMDGRILGDAVAAMEKSKKAGPALAGPNIWRTIMKNRITKLAAAAVIIIVILFGLKFTGGPDVANTAWAEVTSRVAKVDYVHVYWFKSRGDDFFRQFEAWYAHGKLVRRGDKGGMTYDDRQTQQTFDEQGRRVGKKPSLFAEGKTFFELFSAGLLSDENEQLSRQMPTNVGDDFLIYEVDPPSDWNGSQWLEYISVTVGKNSLLPVQMKIFEKDSDDYDLVMFDYEAPEKPPEFFEPPMAASANGQSEVVLDGEEVVINIEGAPGLKQAIVRLYDKYDGPAEKFPLDYIHSNGLDPNFCRAVSEKLRKKYEKKGGPIFRLKVSFVTDEGYRSGTNDIIATRLNEAGRCGVGSSAGGLDGWPDGKYRNVKFSPLVKSTDREDTYIVEMRCWLRPKDD